jgi:hypothetical protein
MSEVQQDHQDSARRRHLRVRTLLLPTLALTVISAAVGAAVAVLALPPAIATQLVVPRYALLGSTPNSSLEQVAPTVLPSVVTLRINLGGGLIQGGRASSSLPTD